jgi:HEAT repeat protein
MAKQKNLQTGTEPVLLNDEQVREYIANGYVKIELSLPGEIHEAIARKLDLMVERGPNLGNNVLPHAPEFRHVLNAPEVRGALISLLGQDYMEYPHRYNHNQAPANPVPEDIAGAVARNCHQDSYTPLARPRQHYPRFARIIYYPRDTPVEHGPTHVTPGTHFHKRLTDEDGAGAIPVAGPAGSLWITHFDVIHGAGVNLSGAVRHMSKFIYIQRTETASPSWHCDRERWQNPLNLKAPWNLELTWSHMWDWMCGKRDRYDSFTAGHGRAANGNLAAAIDAVRMGQPLDGVLAAIRRWAAMGPEAEEAVPVLATLLNQDPQAARTEATYALGAIGEPAVETLIARIDEAGRTGWEENAPVSWSESAVRMMDEAHALGAMGPAALAPLLGLLESSGEWGRINAAFALGEMGSQAGEAVPALARRLDDDSHRVVRTTLDALGAIGRGADVVVPRIARFLVESRPDWEEVLTRTRAWTARDQVRINAVTALARLGASAAAAEEQLVTALDDPCGYVSQLATDVLLHVGTPTSERAVIDLLMAQRWDPSLTEARPW